LDRGFYDSPGAQFDIYDRTYSACRLDFPPVGHISDALPHHFPMSLKPLPLIAALSCAAAFCAPHANARGGDELTSLINNYRAAPGACAGRPAAPAGPLTLEPALSKLRIGPGTFLESALKKAGYAAEHVEAFSVTGPEDAEAAMTALRERYCGKLLSGEFSAVGTARVGNAWQVVLARPLVFPALPDPAQLSQEMLALVNRARATPRTCGTASFAAAPPLAWNDTLSAAALGHSRDMADKHYFNHKEPGGSDPATRATQAGYRWSRISENIAAGQRTVAEAVQGWLDSPGHCANIMNPAMTEMGAAFAVNPANENRTVYWTQMFGRP
jgi:uncharacterized protein YkwD